MKTVIGDRITKVEVSTRLVESPATLVQSEYGVSPNMQKYLRAQAAQDTDQEADFAGIFNQAVLEINPEHHHRGSQGSCGAGRRGQSQR